MNGVYLFGTDLSNTDLQESSLKRAKLDKVNIRNANLTGADLQDASGITIVELEKQARSLQRTICQSSTNISLLIFIEEGQAAAQH